VGDAERNATAERVVPRIWRLTVSISGDRSSCTNATKTRFTAPRLGGDPSRIDILDWIACSRIDPSNVPRQAQLSGMCLHLPDDFSSDAWRGTCLTESPDEGTVKYEQGRESLVIPLFN
jgi:hypothetical protein